MNTPYLVTDNKRINSAYRMAAATLFANIVPYKGGVLKKEEPAIIAGLGYRTPWTRDASINTWNAGGLICPETAKSTLKSCLTDDDGIMIKGEYWDKIIWTIGAWQQYLYTGDREFLSLAYEAVTNTLAYQEQTEFSKELNLFRGPACYGDGVAAYPDIYAKHGYSGIIKFSTENRGLCDKNGVGIPMYTLSTNCLYYRSYIIADKMAHELGREEKYGEKAEAVKRAINRVLWNEEKGNYDYLFDSFGGSEAVEGMGISFAILFGIADKEKQEKIFKNTPVSAHGITCVYPSFSRYASDDGMSFGRHSGTVWPHIQGFWASAAALCERADLFDSELSKQTENALRGNQFAEIYHPITGEVYGGMQEDAESRDMAPK